MKITPAYLEEQRRLHADPRGYGARGLKWAGHVMELTCTIPEIERILDYGAGQGSLGRALRHQGFHVTDYDPAFEPFSKMPRGTFDMVTCTDVLEHVEEECVPEVLDHIRGLAPFLFVVISLVPTAKTLSDGRQAHITLKPRRWWIDMIDMELWREFTVQPEKQFVGFFKRKDK